MENQFEKLSESELNAVLESSALISILAAASDQKMDRTEMRDAIEMSHIRTFTAEAELKPFYKMAEANFNRNLQKYLPHGKHLTEEDKQEVIIQMTKVYDIIKKLDPEYQKLLRKSLSSYAKHVADSHPKFEDIIDFSLFKLN